MLKKFCIINISIMKKDIYLIYIQYDLFIFIIKNLNISIIYFILNWKLNRNKFMYKITENKKNDSYSIVKYVPYLNEHFQKYTN